MCWVQFLFILVSQNSPKSKLKLALLSAVEQSSHPTLGPGASKASAYSSRLSRDELTLPLL